MADTLQEFKAELFRTLAHPARIRILEVLRESGSLTVGDIQQRVGIEPSNASQHLSMLRSRGLVNARREGTSVWYSIAQPDLHGLLDAAKLIFESQVSAQVALLASDIV